LKNLTLMALFSHSAILFTVTAQGENHEKDANPDR
jgi:hypothetical protein